MKSITAVVLPFDAFGSAGTAAGAQLLADVLLEAKEDAAEAPESRVAQYTQGLVIAELELNTLERLQEWREEAASHLYFNDRSPRFTAWLTGNHLGVLPVLEGLTSQDLVVQLDAHFDCYDLPDTETELSHGNFLCELGEARPKIMHIGSRDLFVPHAEVREWVDAIHPAEECHADFEAVLSALKAHVKKAKRVWLDLDTDALDPAFAPGVVQPMPFGLTPAQLWRIFDTLAGPKLCGLSISEFSPGHDRQDTTLQLLAWFLERVLLKIAE
jgi:agmatinase